MSCDGQSVSVRRVKHEDKPFQTGNPTIRKLDTKPSFKKDSSSKNSSLVSVSRLKKEPNSAMAQAALNSDLLASANNQSSHFMASTNNFKQNTTGKTNFTGIIVDQRMPIACQSNSNQLQQTACDTTARISQYSSKNASSTKSMHQFFNSVSVSRIHKE